MPKRPAKDSVRWVNIARVLQRQTDREVEAIRDTLQAVADEETTPEQIDARVKVVREKTVKARERRARDFAESWFGILFVGPDIAEEWNRKRDLLTQDEALRKADLRGKRTKEQAPELFGQGLTKEGQEKQQAFTEQVLGEAFGGWLEEPEQDPDVSTKPEDSAEWAVAWAELAYLTRVERIALMREAVDAQSLSQEDFFRPEDPVDLGSDEVHAADGGNNSGAEEAGEAA